MSKKVFLGGTCNESDWRDRLIPLLEIDYFNPVVDDWDEEAYQRELKEREECDFCLYTITPRMTGVYSIAEVVDDSNKRPEKTIFCKLYTDKSDYKMEKENGKIIRKYSQFFNPSQIRSIDRVGEMVERNGGKVFNNLEQVANYLNTRI